MQPWTVIVLASLFVLPSKAALVASPLHHPRPLPHHHAPPSHPVPAQQGYMDAIVREIKQAEGLLIVETALGVLHVRLMPQETRQFQVGEHIQVQLLAADATRL